MSEYIFFNGSRVKNIAGNIYGDMKVKEVCGIKNSRTTIWRYTILWMCWKNRKRTAY